MTPALRRSAAHVFVETLDAPTLAEADEHHLRRVLRLRAGEVVSLADNTGAWAEARLTADGLERVGDVHRAAASPSPMPTLICAVPKGDRPDLIVQKATEIGIGAVLFAEFERTVVRWDRRRAAAQLERLARVGREAAMQSRRLTLPHVELIPADDVRLHGGHVAVAEPAGAPFDRGATSTIVVGPEGGFTERELASWTRRVALSSNVLRVETAAIVAAHLLCTSATH
jgi:16S rRNA (uracil1498-N3)-methyltransferase